jgi:ABC-type multidrug transport system fused ATPase/permease subunit
MRLLLALIAIAILAPIAEWFGPWWSAAIVAGIIGFISRLRTGEAFLAGFWGIALAWLAFILYKDIANGSILTQKMAQVFHLPSYLLYIFITFLLGGIAGGLPAWAGAHLRRMIQPSSAAVRTTQA